MRFPEKFIVEKIILPFEAIYKYSHYITNIGKIDISEDELKEIIDILRSPVNHKDELSIRFNITYFDNNEVEILQKDCVYMIRFIIRIKRIFYKRFKEIEWDYNLASLKSNLSYHFMNFKKLEDDFKLSNIKI